MIKACIVVPVYDHERAIADTVSALKPHGLFCYLVDDGSGAECARVLDGIAAREAGWVKLLRHPENRGKGAAVMTGCVAAQAGGYTHAVQVDSDGQHDLNDLPKLLALAQSNPRALVTGIPIFDASVPKSRFYGRYLTHFWVWINTLSLEIRDSMCGFRVYPIAEFLKVWNSTYISRRMAFDSEIMVRLYWRGVPVLQQSTRVTYPRDGVSHFDLLWDNVRITGTTVRLILGMLLRLPVLLTRLLVRLLSRHAAKPKAAP